MRRLKRTRLAQKVYHGTRPDPDWQQRGLDLLLEKATPWQRQGNKLVNRDTGDILAYRPDIVTALLLDRPFEDRIEGEAQP